MPIPSTSLLAKPKNWDEFEDICADIFSKEWNDANTTRYGRSGQRQNGVDIYGTLQNGSYCGVQCKGRSSWPPKELKTGDIDKEVAKAKAFKPALSQFIVATTSPDDTSLQDHARLLTERHRKKGLFSVFVFGWSELTRRLTQHQNLVDKHFPLESGGAINRGIQEIKELILNLPEKVAADAPSSTVSQEQVPEFNALSGFTEVIEQDLASRYSLAIRRALFREFSIPDPFRVLAQQVIDFPYFQDASPGLRRRIILRAVRSAAVKGSVEDARTLLARAATLFGDDSDLPARARIEEATGNFDTAVRLLRDEKSSDCRSTLLNILLRARGADAALEWFAEQSLSLSNLTTNGIHTLCLLHLEKHNLEEVRRILNSLNEQQLEEGPYFFLVRGVLRFAALFPPAAQERMIHGFPLSLSPFRPISLAEELRVELLDAAIGDLSVLLTLSAELGLREAKETAQRYLRWCELLHPRRKLQALARVKSDLSEPKTAVGALVFGFAFIDDFDPSPIAHYLERHSEFGGLDEEELQAMFVLRMNGSDPRALIEFISKYRSELTKDFTGQVITSIEIQALTEAGDIASARLLLNENVTNISSTLRAALQAEIERAEGTDPVSAYLTLYESTNSVEALRMLVGALIDRKDWRAIARYSEELFQNSRNPVDIDSAAKAFANLGDRENFIRLVEAHTSICENDPELKTHYAWQLFHGGQYAQAMSLSEKIRQASSQFRDLDLECGIAIETGQWEMLSIPLAAFLEGREKYHGRQLIQAARLAQTSDQGLTWDLMKSSVAKSPDDPEVLLGAYMLVLDEGQESHFPEAGQWFSHALDLSKDDGLVKRFELKELLSKQLEWNERSRNINETITRGDVPLSIAAPALNSSLVEIVLGNLIRNDKGKDSRRRVALPLFSGSRELSPVGDISRIAIDITSLITLGWLGIVKSVLDSFSQIVIAAGTLSELFDGRRRIRRIQKSRILQARNVQEAIANGKLRVLPNSTRADDAIVNEVGNRLATLIRAAQTTNGVVLRPMPVVRPGLEVTEATINVQEWPISDMHMLLVALVDLGAIDHAVQEKAQRYFTLQDKGLPGGLRPEPGRPLYLDDVALSYLEHTGLFDVVIGTFNDVVIGQATADELRAVNEHENLASEALLIIDEIRKAIRDLNAVGKVMFAPQSSLDSDNSRLESSTFHLLANFMEAEAVCFDDRFLNREPFAEDQKRHRIPCVTSLDLVERLRIRGRLTDTERNIYRHRLRIGGAVLLPVDSEEIIFAALRSGSVESAEGRAIRESIDLARASEIPRFPKDISWLGVVNAAARKALFEIWTRENNKQRASGLASWIFGLIPKPADWVLRWDGKPPENWVQSTSRNIVAGLALSIMLKGEDLEAYNKFLEENVLASLRISSPDYYSGVVQGVNSLIMKCVDDLVDE